VKCELTSILLPEFRGESGLKNSSFIPGAVPRIRRSGESKF
jgi:hypothetical protein